MVLLCDFFVRNEGQLVAGGIGVIIAVFSGYISVWFSENKQKKNQKSKYQDLLNALSSELIWQENSLKNLSKLLVDASTAYAENGKFITNNLAFHIDIDILKQVIFRITEYYKSSEKIFVLLTSYKNCLNELQHFLNFHNAQELLMHLEDKNNASTGIEDYFSTLKSEYLDKALVVLPKIQRLIRVELKNYPKGTIRHISS